MSDFKKYSTYSDEPVTYSDRTNLGPCMYCDKPVARAARVDQAERERDAALERERRLREALLDSSASLVAATSLLERGGMNAAPSDKMFRQMKEDYEKSIERARSTLASTQEDNRDA